MIISDEMSGVIERNAGSISIEQNDDGSTSLKILFEPDLDAKSEDGKIFIKEVLKLSTNIGVCDDA
jgi:hypothetical protein